MSFENLLSAFLAGIFSFFAPCLLPLFPSYFSAVTGFTFTQLYGLDFTKLRSRVFLSSLFFAGGFALVFTALGMTGSLVGQLLEVYLPYLLKFSGVFLIILGVLQLGIIKIPALEVDYAWKIQRRLTDLGFFTALITGVAAALSWIPCIGPLLAPILLLSAKNTTVWQGGVLLLVYSLGLTLPFLLGGLFFPGVVSLLQNHRRAFHRFSQIAGVFLIVFGVIILLDKYRFLIEQFNLLIILMKDKFI